MRIRELMAACAIQTMLHACASAEPPTQNSDIESSWFAFGTRERTLTVDSEQDGHYTFLALPTDDQPELKMHSGILEPGRLRQLRALLTRDLATHYVTHNPAQGSCIDAGGYLLTGTGGGCWLTTEITAVTDAPTKELLAVVVPLYEEKQRECLAQAGAGPANATPPGPTVATPHK